MKKKIIPYLVFLCAALLIWKWTTFSNRKPDDEITQAIREAVGQEVKFVKWEKAERPYKQYYYDIKDYDDEDLLVKIADAAQNAVNNMQEEKNFVSITLWGDFPCGSELIVSISNYYDSEHVYYPYDGFEHLEIYGADLSKDCGADRYNDIAAYTKLKNIRYLECAVLIEKSALEQNIVWQDVWPTLDKFAIIQGHKYSGGILVDDFSDAVYGAENQIVCWGVTNSEKKPYWHEYDYMVSYTSENVLYKMVEAVDNNYPEFVKLCLLELYDKGVKPIAIIYNYYETEDGMVLYNGFKRLEIYGSDYLDPSWADILFNDAAAYDQLEDIRSIKYSQKLKETNLDPEAVWKNIWENLEECEIMESE